ncbi:hypothetical protein D0812_03795 [Vibrio owensii]|uniref:Uncharacterized protein n=1 Tax=Vibrio owensii TaxID=696485 RepID=A0AAP9K9C3_9VIBR|nr:hypothetical protein C1N51_10890 [Vibrio campbellii]AYO13582.1 hypothetical protein D0812_03795 [Vibrio owensii]NOH66365.1 hypothetical protein [Vibrio rotiferianus]AYO10199.1 hypothetical protein D0784_12675 [Vibrio campbellii]AYO18934.1 hypothetical protein D0856_01570 [Vibrio owensii]
MCIYKRLRKQTSVKNERLSINLLIKLFVFVN